MIQATLLDLNQRKVSFDGNKNYFKNGVDDEYAEKQILLINNSVTAKTASSIMCQNIIGDGYGSSMDDLLVNKIKKINLYKLASMAIKSKVNQRGVFFHVKYNANFEKDSIEVIPFENCRIGKKDDKDYHGKILVSKSFKDSKIQPEVLDVYNSNPKVIEKQVRASSGNLDGDLTQKDWSKYKGQVLFINDDMQYIYPLSRIDAVQNDCDSESQASLYKNRSLRSGSFGKTIFITPPLVDDDIEEYILDVNEERRINPKYREALSEKEAFKKTVETFFGAENTGDAVLLETDFDGEDLEKSFIIKNYESNINDKMFEFTEKSTRRNILFAFNNLPVILVEPSESVFSSSGESIIQAQKMYWRNNKQERFEIENVLTELLTNFKGSNYVVKTQHLFNEEQIKNNDNN